VFSILCLVASVPLGIAIGRSDFIAVVLLTLNGRQGLVEEPKPDVAKAQIQALTQAVEFHRLHTGEFPATLDDLTRPEKNGRQPILTAEHLKDPWGREYKYDRHGQRNGGMRPDIWSDGPKADGTDLIGNWMLGNRS
jgi:hypothetical protein